MKARPILFSAPMVKALLAGSKTQTRRVANPMKAYPQYSCASPEALDDKATLWWWDGVHERVGVSQPCPYGKPGDALYVKEAWRTAKCLDAGYHNPWAPMKFEADGYECSNWHGFGNGHEKAVPGRYRHARFMPRWASRLTLRISEVRVERLQDISETDARAEGVSESALSERSLERFRNMKPWPELYRPMYSLLWDQINGDGSWAANPLVWAISFSVIQKNVAEVLANGR